MKKCFFFYQLKSSYWNAINSTFSFSGSSFSSIIKDWFFFVFLVVYVIFFIEDWWRKPFEEISSIWNALETNYNGNSKKSNYLKKKTIFSIDTHRLIEKKTILKRKREKKNQVKNQ